MVHIWECRYVTRDPPPRFRHPAFASSLPPGFRILAESIGERDHYLLAKSPHINLKIRHRSGTLKLKTLQQAAPDGLELWRTNFEDRLPASRERWAEVSDLLGCEAVATTPDHASSETTIDALSKSIAADRIVRVDKTRTLYGDGVTRIELARFVLIGELFETICLEAADASHVRALQERFATHELGPPRNYLEVLAASAHRSR